MVGSETERLRRTLGGAAWSFTEDLRNASTQSR